MIITIGLCVIANLLAWLNLQTPYYYWAAGVTVGITFCEILRTIATAHKRRQEET